jgi:hypothetical protein
MKLALMVNLLITDFLFSYNTEDDAEEQWNHAYWEQDKIPIIDTHEKNEEAKILFHWYKEKGLER